LYVAEYRVLENLTIDFARGDTNANIDSLQPQYRLDFLVGLNGSGKSTVLHLLSRIFKNVLLDEGSFPITVELNYSIDGHLVTLSNRPTSDAETETNASTGSGGSLRYEVQRADGKRDFGSTRLPLEYIPAQVVVYTTGNEASWLTELTPNPSDKLSQDQAFPGDESRFINEMPGHPQLDSLAEFEDSQGPPLLFIPGQRLPLITLCGLIASRKHSSGNEILQPVLRSMKLERFVGFSLRIRFDPDWKNDTRPDVITRLLRAADHQIQQGADRLLVFNFEGNQTNIEKILNLYTNAIDMFHALNGLCQSRRYYDAPLQEVSLFFRSVIPASSGEAQTAEEPALYSYESLSDGERSFLGRMALFALFRARNLLIMLDEPEVHFNDSWKREIVNTLHDIMRDQPSHALITTHSSIALTDVPRESIMVLRRNGVSTGGQDAVRPPDINTLGADPSDILVHVFGTGTAAGTRGETYIGIQIAESRTISDLAELEKMVAPGYWRYRIELQKRRLLPQTGQTA
jgi:predicted ATPase